MMEERGAFWAPVAASNRAVTIELGAGSGGRVTPQGDQSTHTDKQKRKAEAIADSYEERGVPQGEAERRAWATVNKDDGGGNKPGGSGRSKRTGNPAAHNGGKASASRTAAERSASAKKAAATRKRNREKAAGS